MILLAPVLLLLALSGCSSKVVNSFIQTCPDFFANPGGTLSPPTVFRGNNYKQICQIRGNTYGYATLYDTANRIPVYSAYKFDGLMQCTRLNNWYIEPQLEQITNSPKMAPESSVTKIQNQAVNEDYDNSGYHRGHLAPVYHATSQSCSDATFTLTNAAPQDSSFNTGQWRKTEKDVAETLGEKCKGNSAYIVTGVVPGPDKLNNRVRIPSHFWSAYCCLDNNLKVKAARGFIGENENDPVQEMSIKTLNRNLSDLYGKVFRVFGGNCN
ncbi:endonuclease domain-containing 1 protein-like [Colossoma macropomum]|uniref:endonuclease domain-containing 1 protein-like n=1 Tax=Colossoma macropomum TaxID=42526 RepID=UPI0018642AEA|nr:endonuclease domain-containing 1 protein-like [Colossoma macropomum]